MDAGWMLPQQMPQVRSRLKRRRDGQEHALFVAGVASRRNGERGEVTRSATMAGLGADQILHELLTLPG